MENRWNLLDSAVPSHIVQCRGVSCAIIVVRHPLRHHVMGRMLTLCEGHVFVELNYPHIIGMGIRTASRCGEFSSSLASANSDVHQSCQIGS